MTFLECSINGTDLHLDIADGSRLAEVYPAGEPVVEAAQCNYGLRPDLIDLADTSGMRVSASDASGECRAVEVPGHPFFIATLYLPQLKSTPTEPHPLFVAFVGAVAASSLASRSV